MDVFNDSELADPTADNGPRKSIFKRLRLPVIEGDKANEEARDKQANKRFMPYLSGDNGDHPETSSDPNDRNRWASLSQLQYGRLEKWSQGNFTTGEKEVPYESFDKIPLAEQPSALTRAPLERCVGAPMYPGIEVFWVAQLEEMYKLEDKYRFADSVTPGDLSKGLCLPWQSDFNMCNTYWWPSIRPDNVVTDTYFQQQLQQFQSNLDQLASNLENRERWDRGIKGSEIQTGVPIEANSDMVRHWRDLGFVARQLYGATSDNLPEIYIEKQRNPNFPPA
ncbi:unnamed protein product [Rhizoctonia solani]|uniref:L-lysine epsilon oxidase C-terminal domain-containing protein n=1 Tax=Rhizoctonia solani TaxID=456999 RepID=A0A8H3E1A3_9AGAM|nr:unnamed protein product [Rhizoctonia solani]